MTVTDVSLKDTLGQEPLRRATFCSQLKASVRRIQTKKKRRPWTTAMEIIVPLIPLLLLLIIKFTTVQPKLPSSFYERGNSSIWSSEALTHRMVNVENEKFDQYISLVVRSTKDENKIKDLEMLGNLTVIMTLLARQQFEPPIELHFIHSGDDANYFGEENKYEADNRYFATIVFDELESNLNYTIHTTSEDLKYWLPRVRKNATGSPDQCRSKANVSHSLEDSDNCEATRYYHSGFASLMALVDYSWLQLRDPSLIIPVIRIQLFPKDAFEETTTLDKKVDSVTPYFIVMSMTLSIPTITAAVVEEKERRVRQLLRMSGLRDSAYWLSWIVADGFLVIILSILAAVIVHFASSAGRLDSLFFKFFLFLEYEMSITMFGLMLAAFFRNSRVAFFFGIFSFGVLLALSILDHFVDATSLSWILSIFSTCAFMRAVDELVLDRGSSGSFPLFGLALVIFLDILLYISLAAYFDQVVPVGYGAKRKPFYFLGEKYWKEREPSNSYMGSLDYTTTNRNEPIPEKQRNDVAVRVKNLSKIFTQFGQATKIGLNKFQVELCRNEITALVGHNGSGKTLFLNSLASARAFMDLKTFHRALLCRSDQNQMDGIRTMLGYSAQKEILFPDLTVEEHLQFFATIRGVPEIEVPKEIAELLEALGLKDAEDHISSTLSPNLRRRLAVATSVIGGPKLIVLDEPASLISEQTRRLIWRTLRKYKEGRVIVLSTHFLSEVEILCRRKVIITKGEVRCSGSSPFLKDLFGIGYHLLLQVLPDNPKKLEEIKSKVLTTVENSELETERYQQYLSFLLPKSGVDKFPALLKEIQRLRQTENIIKVYSIRSTSLDEVFLFLGREAEGETEQARVTGLANEIVKKRLSGRIHDDVAEARGKKKKTPRPSERVREKKVYNQGRIFIQLTKIRLLAKLREPVWYLILLILPILITIFGSFLLTFQIETEAQGASAALNFSIYDDRPTIRYTWLNGSVTKRFKGVFDHLNQTADLGYSLDRLADDVDFPDYLSYPNQLAVVKIFENQSYTSFLVTVNDTYTHGIPLILNAISNWHSQQLTAIGNVSVSSLPSEDHAKFKRVSSQVAAISLIGLATQIIPMGLAFDIVKDRIMGAKNLLIRNGVSLSVYYLAFFSFYGIVAQVPILTLVSCIYGFQIQEYLHLTYMAVLLIILMSNVLPVLLFFSTFSYLFHKVRTTFNIFIIALACGVIPNALIYLVATESELTLRNEVTDVSVTRLVLAFLAPPTVPYFALKYIGEEYSACASSEKCRPQEQSVKELLNVLSIYTLLLASAFQLIAWSTLTNMMDIAEDRGNPYRICQLPKEGQETVSNIPDVQVDPSEDQAVVFERNAVKGYLDAMHVPGLVQGRIIAVYNLAKEFELGSFLNKFVPCISSGKKVIVVRNLTFGVFEGHVFGLVGPGSSGKTTIIRMIMRRYVPTSGRIVIAGEDIYSEQRYGKSSKKLSYVGYCPQMDALWDSITVDEHLVLYAIVNGVKSNGIKEQIEAIKAKVNLDGHLRVNNLSVGQRRSLSFALSILGDPSVLVLDEPTKFMDLEAKKNIWKIIRHSYSGDKGVLVSTSNIQEAYRLCDRMGFLVHGKLRYIGTPKQLKKKFGMTYILEVKLYVHEEHVDEKWKKVSNLILQALSGCKLVENERLVFKCTYTFSGADVVVLLPHLFEEMETMKTTQIIEDYVISQATLERAFLDLQRMQESGSEGNLYEPVKRYEQ